MTLHSSFSRYFYWPLAQKIKGEYAKKALENLNVSQWKSQNELTSKQWQLVECTVKKAIKEKAYQTQTAFIQNTELTQAVEQLPADMRLPLLMYYFDGRKVKSVAEKLDMSTAHVYLKIRAATNRLHEIIVGQRDIK